MDTIIGLGAAGCNIAKFFSQYPEYKCYLIDSEEHDYSNSLVLPKQKDPESYEQNCPMIWQFLKGLTDDVYFVLSGSGATSGASLRLLEQIKDRTERISIFYIRPDTSLLSEIGKLQEKIVFNVLQEYVRSGVFLRMYLIDNCSLEKIVGDVSVIDYYSQLNEVLASAFHMINVFDHSKSVDDTFETPHGTARIMTIGITDLEKKEQNMFFSLDKTREIRYYFAITEDELKKDSGLFSKIKSFVKENNTEETKASYGIYSTKYERNFGYAVSYSSNIQK